MRVRALLAILLGASLALLVMLSCTVGLYISCVPIGPIQTLYGSWLIIGPFAALIGGLLGGAIEDDGL